MQQRLVPGLEKHPTQTVARQTLSHAIIAFKGTPSITLSAGELMSMESADHNRRCLVGNPSNAIKAKIELLRADVLHQALPLDPLSVDAQ
jgi:hypothetical protein